MSNQSATAPAPAHGVCDFCVRTKALNASGVVSLHFLPDTNRHTSRVRRRCPGSFRAPRRTSP